MVSTQKVQCKIKNTIDRESSSNDVKNTVSFWIITLFLKTNLQVFEDIDDVEWTVDDIDMGIYTKDENGNLSPATTFTVGDTATMMLDINNDDDFTDLFELVLSYQVDV